MYSAEWLQTLGLQLTVNIYIHVVCIVQFVYRDQHYMVCGSNFVLHRVSSVVDTMYIPNRIEESVQTCQSLLQ